MGFENLSTQLAILRHQELSPTERLVAIVALSFRNAETGRCNPPVLSEDPNKETLCTRSGFTKQCIMKTLASLESKKILVLKKAVARPSEITFTVNEDYGKQGLPSTTITSTVNEDYGNGKRRLPITDKEQIKNREVTTSDVKPLADVKGDTDVHDPAHVQEPTHESVYAPAPACADQLFPELVHDKGLSADKSAKAKSPVDKKKSDRGTRFSLTTLPDAWRSESLRIQPKADPAKVFEEFRDYWVSTPGAKGRKSDWLATWRNWVRRLNAKDLERLGRGSAFASPASNAFRKTSSNTGKHSEVAEAQKAADLFNDLLA